MGHSAFLSGIESSLSGGSSGTSGSDGWWLSSNGQMRVEWKLTSDGRVESLDCFKDGIFVGTFSITYAPDGLVENATATIGNAQDELPEVLMETVRDDSNAIIGFVNLQTGIYTYFEQSNNPNPLLIETYRDCMRACNVAGNNCRTNAENNRNSAVIAASSAYGAAMAAAIASVVFTGGTASPGAAAAMVGATLLYGGAVAKIDYDFNNAISMCQKQWNDCAKLCKPLKTKEGEL